MAAITFTTLPRLGRDSKQIFVAYPYKLYPADDYRPVYAELEKAFNVKFVFADEKITDLHILQKIADHIGDSRFSIFDISGWNANVTLELGLAYGMRQRAYIAIDPSKTPMEEVPADLRGIDRIQYGSYAQLQEGLTKLLAQEFPVLAQAGTQDPIADMQQKLIDRLADGNKFTMTDIARLLGVSPNLARVIVQPLLGKHLDRQGERRGTRYFLLRAANATEPGAAEPLPETPNVRSGDLLV
jgi:hypothetical protein